MPPRKPLRPVLVEYLLRLVWDEREYARLLKDRATAIERMKKAGLTPKQRTAVFAALRGDSALLKFAVLEECDRFRGAGELLWNAAAFIFGTHPSGPG
jgi:hypothetical protein